MKHKCQECPQNTDQLESLVFALTNPKFDKTPEEWIQKVEEEKEILRKKGYSEKIIEVYGRICGFCEDDKEARAVMLKWGKTRKEAAHNYMTHFASICNWCIDIYTDILEDYVIKRIEKEGIDIDKNPEKVEELMKKAHSEYLENPEVKKLLEIKLEDILFPNN